MATEPNSGGLLDPQPQPIRRPRGRGIPRRRRPIYPDSTPRWLLELGDRPANLRFFGEDVLGPIVYLVERDREPLYVGVSAKGLSRPLGGRHHALYDLQPADTFYIWKFDTFGDAAVFERHLLARLSPERNIDGVGDPDRCRSPWEEMLRNPEARAQESGP